MTNAVDLTGGKPIRRGVIDTDAYEIYIFR